LIYHQLKPAVLEATVGVSMVGMSLWMLKPYKLDENDAIHTQKGVFLITLVALLSRTAGIRPCYLVKKFRAGIRLKHTWTSPAGRLFCSAIDSSSDILPYCH
jgi:hypothetical protein